MSLRVKVPSGSKSLRSWVKFLVIVSTGSSERDRGDIDLGWGPNTPATIERTSGIRGRGFGRRRKRVVGGRCPLTLGFSLCGSHTPRYSSDSGFCPGSFSRVGNEHLQEMNRNFRNKVRLGYFPELGKDERGGDG